jgi:hypothetical protein
MKLQSVRLLGVVFIAFTALFFTSCGDNVSQQALIIPNKSQVVLTTNLSKMALKSDVVKFKETAIFKEFVNSLDLALAMVGAESRTAVNEAMDDPLVLGIDFLEDMYMFANPPELGDGEVVYVGFSFKIADQTRLETFLGHMPDIVQIKEAEGFKYINPDDEIVLAWTDNIGLLLIVPSYAHRENTLAYVEGLMLLDDKKSYLQNEQFKAFVNETKDVGLFYNWALLRQIAPYSMRGEEEEWKGFSDNYSVFTANFTDEKVSVHMENLVSEEFKARFDMMRGEGVSSDFKNCLTDNGSLIAFASVALNIDGVVKMTENEGDMASVISNLANELQMKPADLKSIFTGDIAFSFMDMSEKQVSIDLGEYGLDGTEVDVELLEHKVPVMKAITIVGINDKNKVASAFETIGAKREGDAWVLDGEYYVVLDDKVIWTSDADVAKKMASDGELGVLKNGYENLLSDNPMSAYVSLDWENWPPMVREMAEMSMNRSDRDGFTTFISKFEALVLNGTWMSTDIELKMANTNQNSLKTLLYAIDEAL